MDCIELMEKDEPTALSLWPISLLDNALASANLLR